MEEEGGSGNLNQAPELQTKFAATKQTAEAQTSSQTSTNPSDCERAAKEQQRISPAPQPQPAGANGQQPSDVLTTRSLMLKENSPPNVTVQPAHSHGQVACAAAAAAAAAASQPLQMPPFLWPGINGASPAAAGPLATSLPMPLSLGHHPVASVNALVNPAAAASGFADPALLASLYGQNPASAALSRDFLFSTHAQLLLAARHPLFHGVASGYQFVQPPCSLQSAHASAPAAALPSLNPFLRSPGARLNPFGSAAAPNELAPSVTSTAHSVAISKSSSSSTDTSVTTSTPTRATGSVLDVQNLLKKH